MIDLLKTFVWIDRIISDVIIVNISEVMDID